MHLRNCFHFVHIFPALPIFNVHGSFIPPYKRFILSPVVPAWDCAQMRSAVYKHQVETPNVKTLPECLEGKTGQIPTGHYKRAKAKDEGVKLSMANWKGSRSSCNLSRDDEHHGPVNRAGTLNINPGFLGPFRIAARELLILGMFVIRLGAFRS